MVGQHPGIQHFSIFFHANLCFHKGERAKRAEVKQPQIHMGENRKIDLKTTHWNSRQIKTLTESSGQNKTI
jgi:hypothetical protein